VFGEVDRSERFDEVKENPVATVNNGRTVVEVLTGQVWIDNDPRGPRRRFLVEEIDGVYVAVRNLGSKRRTRIKLYRFAPRSNGYTLEGIRGLVKP